MTTTQEPNLDLFETIASRHSYRAFEARPVARADVERLIDAARRAPSAMNAQPWRFHVATGATRTRVGEVLERTTVYLDEYLANLAAEDQTESAARFLTRLGGAPVVIAVSAPRVIEEMEQLNTLLSVGAAIENLQLAATALGLGSCNITVSYWVRDDLADVFEIGDDRYVVSVIALGYPDEDAAAPAHDADIVSWHE
jgi:nitroreductase